MDALVNPFLLRRMNAAVLIKIHVDSCVYDSKLYFYHIQNILKVLQIRRPVNK